MKALTFRALLLLGVLTTFSSSFIITALTSLTAKVVLTQIGTTIFDNIVNRAFDSLVEGEQLDMHGFLIENFEHIHDRVSFYKTASIEFILNRSIH